MNCWMNCMIWRISKTTSPVISCSKILVRLNEVMVLSRFAISSVACSTTVFGARVSPVLMVAPIRDAAVEPLGKAKRRVKLATPELSVSISSL